MAPQTRSSSKHKIAPILQSIEAESASGSRAPPAKGDDLGDDHQTSGPQDPRDEEPSPADPLNRQGQPSRQTEVHSPTPEPQPYDPETYDVWFYRRRKREIDATVLGHDMVVPQTYDPATYDPDWQVSWTPEPEPYDPKTYAAWGRKHFGEEWYQLREMMMAERNVYLEWDAVFKERQRTLRIIEHKVEGRPFRPAFSTGGTRDPGWKRIWARYSKRLGLKMRPSPTPSIDSDRSDRSETDLDGYNTYDPTPEYHTPTPPPDDPWEALECYRRRFNLSEEWYHFEKVFLKESLIDTARARYENAPGDKQARELRNAMEKYRFVDFDRLEIEERHFQDQIDLPKKGWTREQIVAAHEALVSLYEWKKNNPPPKVSGPLNSAVTDEERAARKSWREKHKAAFIRFHGGLMPHELRLNFDYVNTREFDDATDVWRQGVHGRISRRQRREALADITDDVSRSEALQKIEEEERRDNEVLAAAIERSERAGIAERARWGMSNTGSILVRNQKDMDEQFRLWDERGLPVEVQDLGARLLGFDEKPIAREAASQPPAEAPERAEDTPRRTRHGRVTKKVAKTGRRGRGVKKEQIDAEAGPRAATQRRTWQAKTFNKERERASRRLAGKLPEYGML
ncbi:hypothetical protein NOR_06941 [Metarhizium rileyi]|uniref:Uncharacterized protein n=1 Tax=Metarhizium rileyi (strain RCEF 4871) TaxID=1649241 RepID=A0A166ZFH6_METRR|nr:hypothetical protein NOR_06941 [Metarhizium rileyi RCEF 4871]